MGHELVEVLDGHGAQHAVDGLAQDGVALHHGDADVHVLGTLLLGELEVAVGAGEVKDDHVGVGGHGALGGGHIGADEVGHAGLQRHEHGGGGLGGGHDVRALDLGQAGVIPDGGDLRGAGAAGEIGQALGIGVGAVGLGQADDGGVEVGAREVDLLGALGGHGLTCDDRIKIAGLHTGDERVPVGLSELELPAVGLADLLGDHDIVAVCVGAGDIRDGDGAIGVVALGPVIGGIGTFHGDCEDAVLHAAGNAVGKGGG